MHCKPYIVTEETLMKGPPKGYSTLMIEGPLNISDLVAVAAYLNLPPTRYYEVTYTPLTPDARHARPTHVAVIA